MSKRLREKLRRKTATYTIKLEGDPDQELFPEPNLVTVRMPTVSVPRPGTAPCNMPKYLEEISYMAKGTHYYVPLPKQNDEQFMTPMGLMYALKGGTVELKIPLADANYLVSKYSDVRIVEPGFGTPPVRVLSRVPRRNRHGLR